MRQTEIERGREDGGLTYSESPCPPLRVQNREIVEVEGGRRRGKGDKRRSRGAKDQEMERKEELSEGVKVEKSPVQRVSETQSLLIMF